MYARNNDWSLVIRVFSFRLCVNSNQIEIFPHSFDQLIKVPSKISSNRDIMINLIENIELLKSNCVDFVKSI